MKKLIIYIAFATVAFLAINVIANLALNKYEIDLTEDGVFTLSEGSRKIIDKVNEPIVFRVFFSNKIASGIPALKSQASRVKGLLQNFVDNSNGKIKLQIIDPEPFSDDEDLAVSYGIKGIPIDNQGTKVYFGMAATNSVDDVRSIPFFALDRERFLEYEVARSIYDLSNRARKKVAVLSSEEVAGSKFMGLESMRGSAWLSFQAIAQVFDVEILEDDIKDIPSDVDVLVVAQPRNFKYDALYAIDQFVLKGGHAIVFADPHKEGSGTGNPKDRSFSASFSPLLKNWGVVINPAILVGDRAAARTYTKAKGEEYKEWNAVDYIGWLGLREHNINRESIITSNLKLINIDTPGFIEPSGLASVEIEPLLTSNKESMIFGVDKVRPSPNPNKLLRDFNADDREYVLAAKVSGHARSAFPEKEKNANHVSVSKEPINIVVVADLDILRNELWAKTQDVDGYNMVTSKADNASFFANTVDYLSGNNELISLRGRGASSRPFTRLEEIKRRSEEKYLQKEKKLKEELAETELKLADLKKRSLSSSANSLALKAEQQYEIKRFSDEMSRMKKDLRNVQAELRKEIESLGSVLKFINIWLMPLLVIAMALFVFVLKRRTRK